jgi:integrase
MRRKNDYLPIVHLVENFIKESESRRRLQKNGALISFTTIKNYKALLLSLVRFEEHTKKQWMFNINYTYSKGGFLKEGKHYKTFYLKYTSFMYAQGHVDNTVGMHIKILRSVFIYSMSSKGYEMGIFYKEFYARKEEIPIIVLNQEQLKFLIHNKEFEKQLSPKLKTIKDIFVIGCTIGLRFSDLIALRKINIQKTKDSTYITNNSQKTNAFTRIKIPEYISVILEKYNGKQKKLLPEMSLSYFNNEAKKMAELAGWTDEIGKIRCKRGVKKDVKTFGGKTYRFCDHISSHVMRRTAITTLLVLGMAESLVRKISGHSPNSKEFYKYVKYSDSFLDEQTDRVFGMLEKE